MFAYFQSTAQAPAWYACLLAAARRAGVELEPVGDNPTTNKPVIVPVRPEPFGGWKDRLRPLCEHRRRELPRRQWFLAYGYPHDEQHLCEETGIVVANDLASVLAACGRSWFCLEPWQHLRLIAPEVEDARWALHQLRRDPPVRDAARSLLLRLRPGVPNENGAMLAALSAIIDERGA